MNVFYRIQHNGEEIAVADTLEQVRALVRESRPGTYTVLEVRPDAPALGRHLTHCWGHMIHPDDGPLVLAPGRD
jgi:hypothetical protein